MFDGGGTNLHDKESSDQPSIVDDGLEARIEVDRHFTIIDRMHLFLFKN